MLIGDVLGRRAPRGVLVAACLGMVATTIARGSFSHGSVSRPDSPSLAPGSGAPGSVARAAKGLPAPEEARPDIETLLGALAAAALAGDMNAFLMHIDLADPEFVNEQKYFANEFRKVPPAELKYEIAELRDAGASPLGDAAAPGLPPDEQALVGRLTVTWKQPERPERVQSFDARFVKRAGAWYYAGEEWLGLRAESAGLDGAPGAGGVLVLFEPGLEDIAELAVTAFNAVRRPVERDFELTAEPLARRVQKIKLYDSMQQLQFSISLAYESGLGGWNEPGEPIKLVTSQRSRPRGLRQLLAHEYAHVCTFELGPNATNMAWWILEGVADYSSELNAGARRPDQAIRDLGAEGKLAAWEDITDFHNVKPGMSRYAYIQGHHLVAYIADKFGRPALNRWMSAMARGAGVDQASRDVLQRSFVELDAQWRESLSASPEMPELEPPNHP